MIITVEELYKLTKHEIIKGNGKKEILISRDDEGNSYHELYQGFESNSEEIKKMANFGLLPNSVDVNNIIILG